MWECVESPQSTKTICIDKKLVCLISIHPHPYRLPWKCFVGFILRQFCLFVQQTLYVRLENILSTGSRPLRVTEVALNSSQLWANWIDVFTGNPHFTIILRTLVWLLTELVKTCNMQLPFNLKHISVFFSSVFLLLLLLILKSVGVFLLVFMVWFSPPFRIFKSFCIFLPTTIITLLLVAVWKRGASPETSHLW